MYLIGKNEVEKVWPLMEKGLSRASFEGDVGSVWTLSDVRGDILKGISHGFYSPTSKLSGVMDVLTYPSKSILYIYWAGQDPTAEDPIDYEELDEFLLTVAKSLGCSAIKIQGRKGWERKVKHFGYSLETINLYKEV